MRTIFLFTLLISLPTYAENILYRAPGSSLLEFNFFLKKNPQYVSYVEHQQNLLQQFNQTEEQILNLSDALNSQSELAMTHLRGLQAAGPWTLNTLRFVKDISEKNLSFSKIDIKKDWISLYCRTAVLLNENSMGTLCAPQTINLEKFMTKYPQADRLLIESLGFDLNTGLQPTIQSQARYHWTLLSNSGQSLHFYGTYEQFFSQSFYFKSPISGDCDGFQIESPNRNVLDTNGVYFSDLCVKSSAPELKTQTWWTERKTWWLIGGTLAIGGLVYFLKDKQVSFRAPVLNF